MVAYEGFDEMDAAGGLSELLLGEVAVVTGAAQGNGRAIARGLAAHGAAVAAFDINGTGVTEAAREIAAAGGRAIACKADVRDQAQCAAASEQIRDELGDVSILVNNAGILRVSAADDPGFLESFREQFDTNVLGSVRLISTLLPQLRRRRGRVVNVGSMASFVSVPLGAGYAASKGAVLAFTRTLAEQFAADGIRVNAIAPGVMMTPMTEDARNDPEVAASFIEHTPMRRFGSSEELVGPVVFLVSSMSEYVTGVMLPVDGGYLTH